MRATRIIAPVLLALAATASWGQRFERVSVSSAGVEATNQTHAGSAMSGDGRYVVFASRAGNLLGPGVDTNTMDDVFVFDRETATIERVSKTSAGAQSAFASGFLTSPARASVGISDDGNLVAFVSGASDLVTGCGPPTPPPDCDNNNSPDLFVHNRTTHATTRENLSTRTPGLAYPGIATQTEIAISGDGKWVAWIGGAHINGDSDEFAGGDVWLHEIGSGAVIWASEDTVADAGIPASSTTGPLALSDDGNRVVFLSIASTLVPGDANNKFDVFLFDRKTGDVSRVSLTDLGAEANDRAFYPTISGDGHFVAFYSRATNMLQGGTPHPALYVRDLEAQTTVRIAGPGDCGVLETGCVNGTSAARAQLSDDGRFVAFDYDGTDLFWPGDTDSFFDVYVFDRHVGRMLRLSVDQTGGFPASRSYYPSMTDDGSLVAFTSFANDLVTGDGNGFDDIFVGAPQVVTPIQSVRNPAPRSDSMPGAALVAHKKLVVRTYPRLPIGAGAPKAAVGKLCIDGTVASCPANHLFTVNGEALRFGVQFNEQARRDALDSIDFTIDGGPLGLLTPGVHSFEVRVTPQTPGQFPEIVQKFDALLNETDEVDIYDYPYKLKNAAMAEITPDENLAEIGADFTRAVYPLTEDKVRNNRRPTGLYAGIPAATPAGQLLAEKKLVKEIARLLGKEAAPAARKRRFAAAILPASVDGANPIDALGYTFRDVPEAVVTVDRDDGGVAVVSSTIAHELGHQLGFGEEYCHDPNVFPCGVGGIFKAANPPPRNAMEGDVNGNFIASLMDAYDVQPPYFPGRKSLFTENLVFFRGYQGSGNDEDSWTTPTEYSFLYEKLTRAPSPAVAPASVSRTVVLVTGLIHENGTVAIDPLIIFESDGEFPEPLPGSTYTIEFLDGGGGVLGSESFDLSFLKETLAGDDSEITEEDEVPFALYFDLPDGTETLRFRQGGPTLAEVEKSANAPTVAFTSVVEQAGNVLDLAWSGNDLDGDDLTYTVLYSPDGVALVPLAIDLEVTTFSFDLDDVDPVAFGAFLRVEVSDGWNTGHDDHGIGPAFAVLDADANGVVAPLTDGLLVLRHLFGFTGATLTNGVLGGGCSRCLAADITAYLASIAAQLDVDDNGATQPLSDGLLVLRYLFGFTGTTLTNGVLGASCERCDAGSIVTYLGGLD